MDISEILGSLSQEDINNLQNIASSVLGESTGAKNGISSQGDFSSGDADLLSGIDLNAFSNIASVMSKMNGSNDPRCRLIMSLKPLLSGERQKRADEAMRILKIIELVPVLRDSGLLKGVL